MKRILLISISIIFTGMTGLQTLKAQSITAGPDDTICPGQNSVLTAALTASGGPVVAPTNVNFCAGVGSSCDDMFANAWSPIGFTFNFYGNNYTQVLVSTNGYIAFSGGTPGGYSPWSITANCPSPTNPVNCIMSPWQDLLPVNGTAIVRYKTIGTAPNRKFIVEYLSVGSFSCGAGTCFGTQIHLFETSNIIETHIFKQQAQCAGSPWNNGRAIHGIQNANGTIAHIVPGRNGLNAPWYINVPGFVTPPSSAGPEGRRWTPTSPTNYTITTVPFQPIYMPNTPPAAGAFTWTTAAGGAVGTGMSVTVSPVTTTNYVVTIPYATCATSVYLRDTVRVVVGNLPLTVSPSQTICFGQTANIYANTVVPGATTYNWSPAADLSDPTNDTTNATPAATTVYTVSATNGSCTNTATVTVNVNPLPVIDVTPDNPQICEGGSVNMTATGGTSYVWSPSGSLLNPNSATVTASPNTTTTYTVVVTDANSCVDSAFNTVSFYPNPVVSVTASEPSVCPGYSASLTASGAYNYMWSPSTGLSSPNVYNPIATLTTPQTYTVIGEDMNGCFDTTTFTLLVDPLPQPSFTSQTNAGCEPITVSFQNTSTVAGGNVVAYNWNFEGHGSSNLPNPVVNYPDDGTYDVQLIAVSDSGCVDSITVADFVNVYSVPVAGFYATPQPTTIGDPLVNFVNTSTSDATNCLWDFGSMATSTICNPYYEFNMPGSYIVTLIATTDHGCSDTATNDVVIEDLSEIFIPNSFTPNGDGINDRWFPVGRNLNTSNITINVEVFNRWGATVFMSTTSDKAWDGNIQGGSNELCPMGVYTYRVYFVNEQGKERTVMGNVNIIR